MKKSSNKSITEAIRDKVLNEAWNHKAIYLAIIIATFVSGINMIFWYDRELFKSLDTIKLLIIATCITMPTLFECILLVFILEWYICDKKTQKMRGEIIAMLAAIFAILFNLQIIILKIIQQDTQNTESIVRINIISYIIIFVTTVLAERWKYKKRMKNKDNGNI